MCSAADGANIFANHERLAKFSEKNSTSQLTFDKIVEHCARENITPICKLTFTTGLRMRPTHSRSSDHLFIAVG